jgi:hypothetical protein
MSFLLFIMMKRTCVSVGAFSIDVLLVFCDLNFELYVLDTFFYNKVVLCCLIYIGLRDLKIVKHYVDAFSIIT